jgi:hypothetical protein
MGKNKSYFIVLFTAIAVSFVFFSQTKDVCSDVNKCVLAGDANQLSKYFRSTVEMSVLGNEGYFSKIQAVSVLTEFFKNNPPKDFTVKQGGSSSDNTKFSIGTYESTNGSAFKVYYVVKKEQDAEFINKLTIEKK